VHYDQAMGNDGKQALPQDRSIGGNFGEEGRHNG